MKVLPLIGIALIVVVSTIVWSCNQRTDTKNVDVTTTEPVVATEKARVPDWHKNANIYEVNLRHYTPEGTFAAFQEHLPRLKKMGVDILWFMPIHEVSKARRKGELGSPYAVKDYVGVNPDYGTMEDFDQLLRAIHDQGMYCILDWVPNHTGWDHAWIAEHPEYYTKDKSGNITDPLNPETGESWGWTDVADLDYDNPDTRSAMINAMKFWVDKGTDGFRVDVAHSVPVDFWEEATTALYALRPLFLLAEAEKPALRNNGSFIMDYGWEMHHLLNSIAQTQGVNRIAAAKLQQGNLVEGSDEDHPEVFATAIDDLLAKKDRQYEHGYAMHFTSNHDENSWAGTEFDRMGSGHQAFAVLTATFDGMPLIYSGQESAMDKRLEFFKKDEIPWGTYAYADFYQTLLELKHRNQALWNGVHGGPLQKIETGADRAVYAFTRAKNGDRVVVVINLSNTPQDIELNTKALRGRYQDVFARADLNWGDSERLALQPWEYLVLEAQSEPK